MHVESKKLYETGNLRAVIRLAVLAFAIGMVASALIALAIDRDTLFAALTRVNPLILAIPFGLYLAINVTDTFRLSMVLRQFGLHIGFRRGFVNSVVGILFNSITPMHAGGHPFQIYHLKLIGIPAKTATNVILSRHVEKLITQALVTLLAVPVVIQVAQSLDFGRSLIYAGIGLVTSLAILLLVVLARPDLVARAALRISHRALNTIIVRLSGRSDWAEEFVSWTREMREQVVYLWNKRTGIMLLDAAVGLLNQLLQGVSIWFMVSTLTGVDLPLVNAVLTYIVVNQLVYYVPTPGASGSVEGMHTLVFASLTGRADLTFAGVFLWRIAAYYFHIVFGSVVFAGFLRSNRMGSKRNRVRTGNQELDSNAEAAP